MHQTISSVAVHDGLVIAPDRWGFVHCLDARTGKRHWTHDMRGGNVFGDPLIVDGKIYVGNDDGVTTILALSKTRKLLKKHGFVHSVVAPQVFANGTLFILTERRLYVIGAGK